MTVDALPVIDLSAADVVVPAPAPGPGNWAGAPSAVLVEGWFYLTYRVRRPLEAGRGVSVVVARSRDGIDFHTVAEIPRETFGAESFERPVVLRRPDGGWRLYVSCATPGSKHWWIEAVDADDPSLLETGVRTMVLPGSDRRAVKDPVVLVDETGWRMWLCVHPLDAPGHEDRMTTEFLTSEDGLRWRNHGTVLAPTPDTWDSRGVRVTTVVSTHPLVVMYDGRARAEDNWFETTGLARGDEDLLVADASGPVLRSPYSDGAARYAAAVPLPDGRTRFYLEVARPDGAHDLVTMLG